MWKILKYVMGVIFLVTAVVVGYNHFAKPMSLEERTVATNEWLSGLNDIYDKTHDPELLALAESAQKRMVLVAPEGNGFIAQTQPTKDNFFLIALGRGDRVSPWKEKYNNKDFATTWFTGIGEKKYIFVIVKNGEKLSSITKGDVLGHELIHERDGESVLKNKCASEVTAHTFSGRLWLKIGGEPYQKLLDQRAKEYGEYLLNTNATLPSLSSYVVELEKILGKSISPEDLMVRLSSFEYTSMFLSVDTYYRGKDKAEEKGRLYCELEQAVTK
jgi:hypothetical protein